MKNLFFYLLLFSLMFNSCNKIDFDSVASVDETIHATSSDPAPLNCDDVFGLIELVGDKLKVLDTDHLSNVCECFQIKMDKFDETTESMVEFDENQIYIDFENQFEFSSLRAQIQSDIIDWEKAINQSSFDSPEDQYIAPNSLLTLFNLNCELYIGDIVMNLCEGEASMVNPEYNKNDDLAGEVNSRWNACISQPPSPPTGTPSCCYMWYNTVPFLWPNNQYRRLVIRNFAYGFNTPLGQFFNIHGGKIKSEIYRTNGNRWEGSRKKIKISQHAGTHRDYWNTCGVIGQASGHHNTYRNRISRDRTKSPISTKVNGFTPTELCTTASVKSVMSRAICNN